MRAVPPNKLEKKISLLFPTLLPFVLIGPLACYTRRSRFPILPFDFCSVFRKTQACERTGFEEVSLFG